MTLSLFLLLLYSCFSYCKLVYAAEDSVPVYRLYNYISSEHLYTTDKSEYDSLIDLTNRGESNWIREGVAWYAPSAPDGSLQNNTILPVYRLYNQSLGRLGKNAHYYTSDTEEINRLASANNGWTNEGIFFYSGGTTSIYTAYSEKLSSAHLYTSSKEEYDNLDSGWDKESSKNNSTSKQGIFQAIKAGQFEVNWSVANNIYTTGTYRIEAKCQTGTFVDVDKNQWARGANIQTWNSNNSNAQKWWLESMNSQGSIVRFCNAWNVLRMDVENGSSHNGANVRLWVPNDSDAQKWQIEISNEGNIRFKNLASQNYLDVTNGLGAGSNIFSHAGNGGLAQSFALYRIDNLTITGNDELDERLRNIINGNFGATGDLLRKSYDYTRAFAYRSGSLWPSGIWSPSFALEMLRRRSGNCYRFAALFNELAHALNYNSNAIRGEVLQTGGWAAHGWVEIYLGGQTLICDPEISKFVGGNFYLTSYAAAPCYYR